MPKLNCFKRTEDPDPINSVKNPKEQSRILDTLRATEMFMFVSTVTVSILHALSAYTSEPSIRSMLRYQRTPAKARPSEDNMMVLMRQLFWPLVIENPESPISAIINRKQKAFFNSIKSKAA